MRKQTLVAGLLLGSMLTAPALAQDNMDKLTNMQRTDATFTEIPQTGPTADALQDIVQYINVPEGFEVSLYAVVPDARSITFDIPNGPCFSRDGFLYIAERNRVLVFPAAEFFF